MKVLIRLLALLALGLLLVPATFAGRPASPKNAKSNAAAKKAAAKTKASAAKTKASPARDPAPQSARDDQETREWKPMPATTGTLGIFTIETGDTLPKKGFSVSVYANKFSRAPGDVSVLGVGWNLGVGITNWLTGYVAMEPYRHIHAGQPTVLSLGSFVGDPQFDSTIYRIPFIAGGRPAYVEDYPFAFTNTGGIGDLTIGAKVSLLSELRGAPFSLSVRNDAIIDTRKGLNDSLGNTTQTGAFQDQVTGAVSKTFADVATAAFNFGYRWTRDPRFQGLHDFVLADQLRVGGGFIVLTDRRFQIMTEYTGIIYTGDATPNITFGPRDPVDGVWGARYYITKSIAVDAGYRYMLNLHQVQDRNGFIVKVGTMYWPEKPQVPDTVSASCSADKTSVMEGSGDTVNVSVQASDSLGHNLNYTWTATGGGIQGNGPSAVWNSAGAAPGTYTITVHVDDGNGNTSSCSEDVRVEPKPIPPPTMTCSADRSTVLVGERVQVSATVNDQSGTPLTYAWRTNGGQIVGSGPSVQLDTSGLAPGNYTVTGRVENGKGGAADCTVAVAVQSPPPPPQASKINECFFRPGSARVDNVCKRILDDAALRLQNDPKARIALVAYSDPREPRHARLGVERGKNATKYLVKKGIAENRIDARAASGQKGAGKQNRRMDIVWVPEGATY